MDIPIIPENVKSIVMNYSNSPNSSYEYLLKITTENGYPITHFFDQYRTRKENKTIWHIAIVRGNIPLITDLIKYNYNMFVVDYSNKYPYEYNRSKYCEHIAKLLVTHYPELHDKLYCCYNKYDKTMFKNNGLKREIKILKDKIRKLEQSLKNKRKSYNDNYKCVDLPITPPPHKSKNIVSNARYFDNNDDYLELSSVSQEENNNVIPLSSIKKRKLDF